MDWIISFLCASPLWGAVLLYWLTNWLQNRRYAAVLRSDHFVFIKMKNGDLIRKGQSSRNWLALFFLGSLQFIFIVILYQSLRSDPISWTVVIIVGLLAAFVAWLMVFFFRLERVSPIYFDSQRKEIRFKDGSVEHNILFADVGQIIVHHAGPRTEDVEKAIRSTYTISISVMNPKKSLDVARITGRSVRKNTQLQEALVELIDSVIQVAGEESIPRLAPLQETDVQMLTPVESQIALNLRKIQKDGGEGNFVIFTVDAEANTYIQLTGRKDDAKMIAETPGNQNDLLEILGWQPPTDDEMNYQRTWWASSHEERLMVAQEIMRTFKEVYGVEGDRPLDVNLNLE